MPIRDKEFTKTITIFIFIAAFYICFTTILTYLGFYTFITKSFALLGLLLLVLLTGRFALFLYDWAIYLALIMLFDSLRGLVYGLIRVWHLPVYASYVAHLEEKIFFGKPASEWLQGWLSSPNHFTWADKISAILYGFHFVYFLLVGMIVWLTRRLEFWRYKVAFLFTVYLALLFFLFLPTEPPLMAAENHIISGVEPLVFMILNYVTPDFVQTFSTNPIAAMPSLHAAFPTLCFLILFYHFRYWAFFVLPYTIAVYFACMLLGAHYFIDIVAGICLASLIFYLVYHTRSLERFASGTEPWAGFEKNKLAVYERCSIALVIYFLSEGASLLEVMLLRHH